MVDVFISYKRERRAIVERLVADLKALWVDVWYDAYAEGIEAFDVEIDRQLSDAKVVLVLWCPLAIGSTWVRAEARKAHGQGKLVQLLLDQELDLPVPYNELQIFPYAGCASLIDWHDPPDLLLELDAALGRDFVGYLSSARTPQAFEYWVSQNADDPIAREVRRKIDEESNHGLRIDLGGWIISFSSALERDAALSELSDGYSACDLQAEHEASLFADDALRVVVCGTNAGMREGRGLKSCLAVAAGGKLFIVDAGSGAADALDRKGIPLARLQAVLLTGADPTQAGDLDELWGAAAPQRNNRHLPVYGPASSHQLVLGLNEALRVGPASGLEPWVLAPEPGKNVVVYEGDGLVVSAFTTDRDAYTGRVGYRFDYRGRSLVVAGDGHAEWAEAQLDADVVLNGTGAKTFGAGSEDAILSEMQVREARAAGIDDVVSSRFGMLLELPLTSREVSVRQL